jgi:hypothetical protein
MKIEDLDASEINSQLNSLKSSEIQKKAGYRVEGGGHSSSQQ